MGAVLKGLTSLITGGGDKAKVDTSTPVNELTDAQNAAANARSALLETIGGQSGDPLSPGQVQPSSRLYGN